jgi:hypothetical protein
MDPAVILDPIIPLKYLICPHKKKNGGRLTRFRGSDERHVFIERKAYHFIAQFVVQAQVLVEKKNRPPVRHREAIRPDSEALSKYQLRRHVQSFEIFDGL